MRVRGARVVSPLLALRPAGRAHPDESSLLSADQPGNGGSSPQIADPARLARAVPALAADTEGLATVALSVPRDHTITNDRAGVPAARVVNPAVADLPK